MYNAAAMPKAYDHWKVLPHQPIDKLSQRVWRLQGKLEGMALLRVMTIAKRFDDRLVIHNGIAADNDVMEAIEAWGEPAFLVVPNGYHRLDAKAFKDRYPAIAVVCPEGARRKVAQVVPVDFNYADYPQDDAVALQRVAGLDDQEGVMVVHDDAGTTLVFNDLLFNMPHGSGFTGFVFKHITQSTGTPRVSRLFRWFVMKDRETLRAELLRLADTPKLARIVVSHYRVIDDAPGEALRRVAAAL